LDLEVEIQLSLKFWASSWAQIPSFRAKIHQNQAKIVENWFKKPISKVENPLLAEKSACALFPRDSGHMEVPCGQVLGQLAPTPLVF
jgi:hypothetical protein